MISLNNTQNPANNDREAILSAVQVNGRALESASETLRNDPEIVLAAIQQFGGALQYASDALKGNRAFVLEVVQQNGRALNYASEELRGDSNIALAAVRQTADALKYVSEELRSNREIVLAAVQQEGYALYSASEELRNDREIVLAAIQKHPMALGFASDALRGDREFVLEAVRQFGGALEYASEELSGDFDIVLAAVQQDGYALDYASEELRNDPDIVLATVQQDGRALYYACEELQGDFDIVLAAVQQNGYALEYASEELRGEWNIVLAAVQQNGLALEHASEELKNDPDFLAIVFDAPQEAALLQGDIDVHDRDEHAMNALQKLKDRQEGINQAQLDQDVTDFIEFLDAQPESQRKQDALYALLGRLGQEEIWPAFLGPQDEWAIRGYITTGEEVIGRIWRFTETLQEPDKTIAKNGMIAALADSIEDGTRVCNPGKTVRLVLSALQGYMPGIHLDLHAHIAPSYAAPLFFTAVQIELQNETINTREALIDRGNRWLDENPAVIDRAGFIQELNNYADQTWEESVPAGTPAEQD